MDDVNHPQHYNTHPSGIETIEVSEWFIGNLSNAIKYVWRAGQKTPDALKDLRKAEWYLTRERKRLKLLAKDGLIADCYVHTFWFKAAKRVVKTDNGALGKMLARLISSVETGETNDDQLLADLQAIVAEEIQRRTT